MTEHLTVRFKRGICDGQKAWTLNRLSPLLVAADIISLRTDASRYDPSRKITYRVKTLPIYPQDCSDVLFIAPQKRYIIVNITFDPTVKKGFRLG